MRGEGKLCPLCIIWVTPAFGDAIARTPPPNDEGEWRRTIFSVLSEGPNVVLIDNLTTLRSGYLASSITSETISDRRVGTGVALTVPVRNIWVATSIDAQLSPEISRRTLRIYLDSGVKDPLERKDFAIPHLKEWAMENRNRLIHAALTIVQGWLDSPVFSEKTFGSFEHFAEFMGGILESAEIPGFLETSYDHTSAGSSTPWYQAAAFCGHMNGEYGDRPVPAKQLVNIAKEARFISPTDDVHVLARKLSQIQDKPFGAFILRKAKVLHNTVLWKLERMDRTGLWESGD